MKPRVVLLIMDGWGIAPKGPGNFIAEAKTPNFFGLIRKCPHTENRASGLAVGLPRGAQGNSEVGHLHIGAGRIVWQSYQRINNAVEDKSFFKNKALIDAVSFAKNNNSSLHLLGLCSDEGVHSHTNHLLALLDMAKKHKLKRVFVHFFADGRDVPEKSAKKYVRIIEKHMKRIGLGKIATLVGRYYSMDRDNNWGRTKEAYDLLTLGKGFKAKNAAEAVDLAYKRGDKTDYYIQPTLIDEEGLVKDNDSLIFFNFRTDRPRQLTKAFLKGFNKFRREKLPGVLFTTMTRYDKTINFPAAYLEEKIRNNLGSVIARAGLRQLRLAETEKYAHVTYFFNSQVEKPNRGEERILIPSPKVPSYDMKPEMSAYEVAEEAVRQISTMKFDFIVVNFANCDLVGHSAVKKAIIRCVEVVDECAGMVVDAALDNSYTVVVTADHGSAEEKLYPDGKPKPAHSSNPVNFILVSGDEKLKKAKLNPGGQKDVAPTILDIMGIRKPKEMTGESLIKKVI